MNYYVSEFNKVLERYRVELDSALEDKIESYKYLQQMDGKYGVSDANYVNRLRIVVCILFTNPSHPKLESLIRDLFVEELKDRTTNSFQGIGTSLEMLTFLLKGYGNANDEELFAKAKEANFDCGGMYDTEFSFERSLSFYDKEYLIDLLIDMNETACATGLINFWQNEKKDWTASSLYQLKYFYSHVGDLQGEIYAIEKRLNSAIPFKDGFDYCGVLNDYLEKLVHICYNESAWYIVKLLMRSMEFVWFTMGLGRSVMENVINLLLVDRTNRQARKTWVWLKRHIVSNKYNLQWNLYDKILLYTKSIGDHRLYREIDAIYSQNKKESELCIAKFRDKF